jgi:hypothetical protein
MVKTLNIILNKTGENGHTAIILDFKGNAFGFSPFGTMAVCQM